MRTFSTAVLGEINKRFATEPLVILEVEWVPGSPIAYCDRKLNDEEYPYPYIVNVSDFATESIVTGSGDSRSITVTMNDVDGHFKSLLETYDSHLKPVRLYLGFQGLPYAEKALMFEGLINSAIVWDEGGRTLTFDVFSKLEDAEVGFTMDDGDFPFIPPAERNRPWPLVFGQVCNMQAVRVTALRKGFLATGQGVMDFTIPERLCQAQKLQCPVLEPDPNIPTQPGAPVNATNVKTGQPDQACLKRRFDEICAILHEQAQQEQYVQDQMIIRGGADFPQGVLITLKIGEVRFEGYMNGETFDITQVYHPDRETIVNPPCRNIPEARAGYRTKPSVGRTPNNLQSCQNAGDGFSQDVVNGSGESWRYYKTFKKSRFIWLPPGTEVFLADEAEIVNIVSLLPGTVDQVAAYRTFGDTTLLTEVPTDLYTVHTVDYGGYDVVEIRLNAPLSTIQDENWDDDIYVSFTSSVGPNPVDTIEWIIEKYTGYTIDATNFATVRSYMTNYPSNFFLKKRMSALKLIRDIAYQARMAVVIRNNVVSLVYLSREPSSLRTIGNNSILPNTFRVSHTETEDLKTRHEVTWSEGEAGILQTDETEYTFVIKHNVPEYGVLPVEKDYYTQNTFDTIYKSATFWMIRDAKTWKLIEFETPLTHLPLDVFDCFTINVPNFPSVKCIVTETRLNAEENKIAFKAWTPVLAGTNAAYYWAWPALQTANAVFPLVDEQEEEVGDGFEFTVVPPEDHPLRAGYDPEQARVATAGDRHPSDLDDTFPDLECKVATGAEIAPDLEPDLTPFEPLAESNFSDRLDDIAAGGVGGGGEDKEEKEACGQPNYSGGCTYEVKVVYITPAAIAPYRSDISGFGGPCNGQMGRPCFGAQHVMCHTFGSLFAASLFASQKRAEAANLYENGLYQQGKTDILHVIGGVTPLEAEDSTGNECEEGAETGGGSGGGDPNAPGANDGETKEPACGPSDLENCGCPPGFHRTGDQECTQNSSNGEDIPCNPGSKRNSQGICVPDPDSCPPGFVPNQFGACVTPEGN